jgi:vacuolar-type H+-ATPase subunit F/Vma7
VSRIVAIGSELDLAGYALAGVEVLAADDPDGARQAWEGLGPDVGLLLLTHEARRALPDRVEDRDMLSVVLPR